jgi:hypothetical protein
VRHKAKTTCKLAEGFAQKACKISGHCAEPSVFVQKLQVFAQPKLRIDGDSGTEISASLWRHQSALFLQK